MIHENDLSWDKDDKPQLNIGDKIQAKVLSIDKEKERIALGLKQLTKDPWEDIDKKYAPGDEIEVKVVSVKNFGAFVKIDKGIESLVPKSEFNNLQPQPNTTARVRIIRIEKDKKRLISSFIND